MNSLLKMCENKSILQIGHNDLDGIMSVVVGYFYILPISFKFNTHCSDNYACDDIEFNTFNMYDLIFFTDFSPEKKVIDYLKQNNIDYRIFDHHISRMDDLKNVAGDKFIFDNTRCGAKIFFDTITRGDRVKKVIYQTIERVQIYDLYQMQSSLWREAKGLSNVLWGMTSWFSNLESTPKYQRFIDAMLYKFNFEKSFHLNRYEIELMEKAEKKERDNYDVAKRNLSIRTDNQGNMYGYFECTSKLSIVANWILQEKQELKYVVCHSTFEDNKGINPKVSIRSLDDRGIDCSAIATLYECGGHKNAAGIVFKDTKDFEKVRKGKMHLI